ncbi:unnamed protein product [Linum trigynum]|uniref:Uncharacterized protein n=1 Tax=Linum trigynum TaxID=586398 RepID=A0AAV2G669_9ROSI
MINLPPSSLIRNPSTVAASRCCSDEEREWKRPCARPSTAQPISEGFESGTHENRVRWAAYPSGGSMWRRGEWMTMTVVLVETAIAADWRGRVAPSSKSHQSWTESGGGNRSDYHDDDYSRYPWKKNLRRRRISRWLRDGGGLASGQRRGQAVRL